MHARREDLGLTGEKLAELAGLFVLFMASIELGKQRMTMSLENEGKIALSPAVELSYLPKEHQQTLLEAMQERGCTPSYSQSVHLKALHTEGKLDAQAIYAMFAEPKANQREKITFQHERVKQFFPRGYTPKQIEDKIFSILEERNKNRDEPEK